MLALLKHMKGKRWILAGVLAFGLLAVPVACSTVGDYETPRYTVVESHPEEKIEIREYPSMVVAEVTVTGDRSEAGNKAFRILGGYIFGNNRPKQEIAMTAPVTQEPVEPQSVEIAMTAPVTQQPTGEDQQEWVVAFMMPAEYTLDELPEATDESIRFRETEPTRAAAITFSGGWSQDRFEKKRAKLQTFLDEQGIAYGDYQFAFYNSPFTLPPLRRNEIIYELQPM